jgi:hypothetical protein
VLQVRWQGGRDVESKELVAADLTSSGLAARRRLRTPSSPAVIFSSRCTDRTPHDDDGILRNSDDQDGMPLPGR